MFWHSLRWIPIHKISLLLVSWRRAVSASISGAHHCEVELQKLNCRPDLRDGAPNRPRFLNQLCSIIPFTHQVHRVAHCAKENLGRDLHSSVIKNQPFPAAVTLEARPWVKVRSTRYECQGISPRPGDPSKSTCRGSLPQRQTHRTGAHPSHRPIKLPILHCDLMDESDNHIRNPVLHLMWAELDAAWVQLPPDSLKNVIAPHHVSGIRRVPEGRVQSRSSCCFSSHKHKVCAASTFRSSVVGRDQLCIFQKNCMFLRFFFHINISKSATSICRAHTTTHQTKNPHLHTNPHTDT